MTRSDYVMIAEVIRSTFGSMAHQCSQHEELNDQLAQRFESDSKRFDRVRFIEAATPITCKMAQP